MSEQNTQLSNQEKFELIESTIKEVQGNYPIDRLIQDCADKCGVSQEGVKQLLVQFDSDLLK